MKTKRSSKWKYVLFVICATALFACLPVAWVTYNRIKIEWKQLPLKRDVSWKVYELDVVNFLIGNNSGDVYICEFSSATCIEQHDVDIEMIYRQGLNTIHEREIDPSMLTDDMRQRIYWQRRYAFYVPDAGYRLDVVMLRDGSMWYQYQEVNPKDFLFATLYSITCGFIGFVLSSIIALLIYIITGIRSSQIQFN